MADGSQTVCKSYPQAECRPGYCGGCIARFFNEAGDEVHCEQEEGIICELKTSTIGCAQTPGSTLNITSANYGRTSRDTCEHPYGLDRLHNDTGCRASNSLSVVKGLCQQRVSCTLTADGSLFGEDPCLGVYKYLEVDFECVETAPCPRGSHYFTNCSSPCEVPNSTATVCKTSPGAECRPDYCGGCIARFYDQSGQEIHCEEEEGFICEQKTNTISCAGTPGTSLNITYANYGRTSQTVCEHPYGLERLQNDTNCRARNSVTVVRGICQDRVACTLKADIDLFGHDPCYGVYKYLEVDFECITPERKVHLNEEETAKTPVSRIVVPCVILGVVAISVVFAVIWKVRHKRRRQGESAVSFVEIAEYHDEEGE